jgi:RHS repeat-associated protein
MGTMVRITNGEYTYLHNDHLGSASAGTNASGAIAWTERYTPFGEALLKPSQNDDLAGYTGHIRDSATGLNYMQARYHDPVMGRFLSVDPVTFFDTGVVGLFNRYTYAYNNPVNIIDPHGLCGTRANNYEDCRINVDRSGNAGVDQEVQNKGIETLMESIRSVGAAIAKNGTNEEVAAWESITEFNINSNTDYEDSDGNVSLSTMATANGTTSGGGSVDIWAEGVFVAAYEGKDSSNHIVIHETYHYTARDITDRKAVYEKMQTQPVTGGFALKAFEKISDDRSVAAGRRLGLLSSGYVDNIYE